MYIFIHSHSVRRLCHTKPAKPDLKRSKLEVSYYFLRERKRLFIFFFLFIIFLCLFSLVQIISCDVSAEKLLLSLSFCVIMVRDGHSYFKHTGFNVENCKRNPLKLPESRLEGSPNKKGFIAPCGDVSFNMAATLE